MIIYKRVLSENKKLQGGLMEKITVTMTKEALYDFLLFHAYSKFSGFLINILGLAIVFMGIIMYVTGRTGVISLIFYFVAAAIFLGYTPLQLKLRAKKQVQINEEYCNPVEYTFSDHGITTEWKDVKREFPWEKIQRAVVTPKTIGIYYENDKALIIPKEDFGEEFAPIFQRIAMNLGMNNVRMR
jgi:hypothetical protein